MSHNHAPNNSSLITTANLLPDAPWTVSLWFRGSTGAGTWRGLFQWVAASGDIWIGVGSSNDIELWIAGDSVGTVVLSSVALNTWYWVALVSASTTSRTGYASNGLGTISSGTNTRTLADASPQSLRIGNSTFTEPCESEIAAIKIWSAALTLNELRAERDSFEPKRRANLNRWTPCWSAGDARDYGPLRSDWTVNGTIVTGVNPPIRYRRRPTRWAKVAGGGSFTVSVAGTLSSSGALLNDASRRVQATLMPSAAILRSAQKGLAASLASAGAIRRQPQRTIGGTLTMAGALDLVRALTVALAGTITSAGALIRGANLVRTGVLAPAAALSRLAQKTLTGAMASAGGLAQAVSRLLVGTMTPTGSTTITKQIQMAVAGVLASAGSLARQVQQALGGTVASSGTIARTVARILTGAVALTGTIRQAVARGLAGTLASTGSLTRALVGQLGAAARAWTWFVDRREPDWRVPRAEPWSADRREPDWPTKE